jgi:hypothetical protein
VNSLRLAHSLIVAGCCILTFSCTDISRFDTGKRDAYCGTIVGASFVREGFERTEQAELRITTSELATEPGQLSTHRDTNVCDGESRFVNAPLRPPTKLESDALSQLEFGQGSELNFMSWVSSTCKGTYLAVISLMHDDSVELRLLQDGSLGVFSLRRGKRGCDDD